MRYGTLPTSKGEGCVLRNPVEIGRTYFLIRAFASAVFFMTPFADTKVYILVSRKILDSCYEGHTTLKPGFGLNETLAEQQTNFETFTNQTRCPLNSKMGFDTYVADSLLPGHDSVTSPFESDHF